MKHNFRFALSIVMALFVFSILPLSNADAASQGSTTTTDTTLTTAPAVITPATPVQAPASLSAAAAPSWNTYQETNRNIFYSGAWGKATSSASSGGAVWLTSAKGATATFTFTGTGIQWIGIKATTYGAATVSVDGTATVTVNMTASSTSYQQALFRKEGLANKTHTLKITITSTKPKLVCVDAFKVQGIAGVPDPTPTPATAPGNGWVAYTEASSYINYYGAWNKATSSACTGGAVKLSNKKGAAFQIRFKGDAIEWDGIRAATYGKTQVTLDAVSQGTVNLTTNATYYKQALFRKTGLDSSKIHTLTITIASSSPALVCVDQIMVHGGSALTFASYTPVGNGWKAYSELSTNIKYSGTWGKATASACLGGAVKLSNKKSASFQVTFVGDGIEWVGIRAKTYGSATVVLDGVTQNAVPLTSTTTQYKQALFHREGLDPNKTHTLKVTITSSSPKLVCVDQITGHTTPPVLSTGASTAARTVFSENRSPAWTFSGSWTTITGTAFSFGSASRAQSQGASITFKFTGTEIRFYGAKNIGFGSFDVYIDNNPKPYARFSSEGSSLKYQQLLGAIKGFSQGDHQITVKTASDKLVELDRVDVVGDPARARVYPTHPPTPISIDRSRPSPNKGGSSFMGYQFTVLHHTASNNVSSVLNQLTNPATEVSANYVITKTGYIYELVPPLQRAWHAGAGSGFGVPANNMNAYSVGIELVNLGNGTDPYPETQLTALQKLLSYLEENYATTYLIDHKMWAGSRKTDLSANFPFARFGVGKYLPTASAASIATQSLPGVSITWEDIVGNGGEKGDEIWIPVPSGVPSK